MSKGLSVKDVRVKIWGFPKFLRIEISDGPRGIFELFWAFFGLPDQNLSMTQVRCMRLSMSIQISGVNFLIQSSTVKRVSCNTELFDYTTILNHRAILLRYLYTYCTDTETATISFNHNWLFCVCWLVDLLVDVYLSTGWYSCSCDEEEKKCCGSVQIHLLQCCRHFSNIWLGWRRWNLQSFSITFCKSFCKSFCYFCKSFCKSFCYFCKSFCKSFLWLFDSQISCFRL